MNRGLFAFLICVGLLACKPPQEAEVDQGTFVIPDFGTITPPNLASLFTVTPEMLEDSEFSNYVLAAERATIINTFLASRYGADLLLFGAVIAQEPEMISPLIQRWVLRQQLGPILNESILTGTTVILQARTNWVMDATHPLAAGQLRRRFDGWSRLDLSQGFWQFYAPSGALNAPVTSTINWQQTNNAQRISAQIRILPADLINPNDELDYLIEQPALQLTYRFAGGRIILVASEADQSGRFSDSELDAELRCWGPDLRNRECP